MNLGSLMQDGTAVGPHQCMMICDSFMMLQGVTEWYQLACEIMLQVYLRTRILCMLVVAPGASFKNGMYDAVFHLVRQCVVAPEALVWIAMGNDIFPPGDKRIQRNFWMVDDSIRKLFRRTRVFCRDQYLIFGGTSNLWMYHNTMDKMHLRVYDAMVTDLVEIVRNMGYPCMTGYGAFNGVEVVDNVGHVSEASKEIITEGLCIVAKWAMVTPRQRGLVILRSMMRRWMYIVRSKLRLSRL